jgi:hypothetical protein
MSLSHKSSSCYSNWLGTSSIFPDDCVVEEWYKWAIADSFYFYYHKLRMRIGFKPGHH